MNSSIIVYRLFDVADEINLDLVQALWASRNKIASRLRLERISTKSITFKDPPVLVELGSHELPLAGKLYLAEIKARIFDLGVISIIIRLDLPEDISYEDYLELAVVSEHMPEDKIHEYLNAVLATIRPACSNERFSDFDEDFVVYYFQDQLPQWDLVPLLLKDKSPLNAQTRQEALFNKFSYGHDITYLTWDSAVVYDNSGSMDIPDLLEFANAQFLELRYYDNALNLGIDRTYDEIEEADSTGKQKRLQRYRQIRGNLMELMADVSSLTSNIDNALQVTEDIF
ncbi:MAG: hypothetical protein RSE47_08260, partial [Acidaminococcaceae bacterium]